ncbi:MAG: hypothetical protein ACE5H3_11500, partial [Planctomycetota bacterium]
QALRGHGEEVWEGFTRGREGTLWYYQKVVEALSEGWNSELLEELRAEVAGFLTEAGASRASRA